MATGDSTSTQGWGFVVDPVGAYRRYSQQRRMVSGESEDPYAEAQYGAGALSEVLQNQTSREQLALQKQQQQWQQNTQFPQQLALQQEQVAAQKSGGTAQAASLVGGLALNASKEVWAPALKSALGIGKDAAATTTGGETMTTAGSQTPMSGTPLTADASLSGLPETSTLGTEGATTSALDVGATTSGETATSMMGAEAGAEAGTESLSAVTGAAEGEGLLAWIGGVVTDFIEFLGFALW